MTTAGPDARGYDLKNGAFWNEVSLDKEIRRVFTVCSGCRLCYKLCPSFPDLYQRVDALDNKREEEVAARRASRGEAPLPTALSGVEPELLCSDDAPHTVAHGSIEVSSENLVDLLTSDDIRCVVDLCYNCKLCYPICPYKPPHEFEVDFPRLMVRAKMVRAKKEGVTTQDKFLGEVDTLGSIMTKIPSIANAFNHSAFNRMLLEKTVGIHRDRQLPSWATQTFIAWWKAREKKRGKTPIPAPKPTERGAPEPIKVVLFYTCFANYNDPDLGHAAVEVLERQGAEVVCPEFKCCGMPFLDGGDLISTLANIEHNVKILHPLVNQGYKIVSPGPTCTFMLKQEYPQLSKTEETKEVAAAVEDLGDFLYKLNKAGRLNKEFASAIGKVAYHIPCHNKVQGIGFRGRDLLKAAGAEVEVIDRCCGMDGTWGMKKEFFEISLKVADKAFKAVEQAAPDIVVTDCPLAGIQLTQGTKRKAYHPVKVLRAAYRKEKLE